jgi:hypothetical protein
MIIYGGNDLRISRISALVELDRISELVEYLQKLYPILPKIKSLLPNLLLNIKIFFFFL